MTKFSLIINVCNSRQDLPSLLNSLLKQTEKDFEVLMFDNASDDGSLAIMKLYADKDKRIKLKSCAKPCLIAKIKNEALKAAKGEIVAFLSPASVLKEDYLSSVWRKIKSHNSDILIANFDFKAERSLLKGERSFSCANFLAEYSFEKNSQYIFNFNIPFINNVFYNSGFLKRKHIVFKEDAFGEDFLFYILTLAKAKSICLMRKTLINIDIYKTYIHLSDMLNYPKFEQTVADIEEEFNQNKRMLAGKLSYQNSLMAFLYLTTQQLPYPVKNFWTSFFISEIVKKYGLDKMDRRSYYVAGYFDWMMQYYHTSSCQMMAETFASSADKIMPVVLTAESDADLYKTDVLLESIISNADEQKYYDIYILHLNMLSSSCKDILNQKQNDHIRITFVDVQQIKRHNNYMLSGSDMLFITLLPQIFKLYKKVLYLKNNVIVLRDISEILDINITDYMLAGVPDYAEDAYIEEKLNLMNSMYINDSVLLFNIAECHEKHLQRMLMANREANIIFRHAKDIMNYVLKDGIGLLPVQYNCKESLLCGNRIIEYYPYRIDDVCILNYDIKHPWQFLLSAYADIWWKYARKSPFYERMFDIAKNKQKFQISDNNYILMKSYIKEALLYLMTFGKTAADHKQKLIYIKTQLENES